jgi:hypothetical protein
MLITPQISIKKSYFLLLLEASTFLKQQATSG